LAFRFNFRPSGLRNSESLPLPPRPSAAFATLRFQSPRRLKSVLHPPLLCVPSRPLRLCGSFSTPTEVSAPSETPASALCFPLPHPQTNRRWAKPPSGNR
jgi:hypothetical protein